MNLRNNQYTWNLGVHFCCCHITNFCQILFYDLSKSLSWLWVWVRIHFRISISEKHESWITHLRKVETKFEPYEQKTDQKYSQARDYTGIGNAHNSKICTIFTSYLGTIHRLLQQKVWVGLENGQFCWRWVLYLNMLT